MDRNKIKKDLLLAAFSHFFYKVAGYLVLTILTRYLSKGEMGEFFFAASLAAFFALTTQLGTDSYLVREVAEKPGKAIEHFSEVVSLRLVLFAFYILLLNGFALIFKPEIADVILLTSVYVLLEQFYISFGSLFVGLKKIKYNVIAGVGTRILLVGLIFTIVRLQGGLLLIIACYILANTILVGSSYLIVRRKIGRLKLTGNLEPIRHVLRVSFPFFILSVLGIIHFKIDSIMLGFIKSYPVVATYEAAYKLFEASQFLMVPLGMIFFPLFSEMTSKENWDGIRKYVRKIFPLITAVGIIITILALITADIIIPFVFGTKYDDSIPVLKILFLTVPLLYLANISNILAKSIHIEKKAIKILLICTGLNIVLNSVSIPIWSVMGAAWSTFISETILAVLLIKLNIRELHFLSSKENVYLLKELNHAE